MTGEKIALNDIYWVRGYGPCRIERVPEGAGTFTVHVLTADGTRVEHYVDREEIRDRATALEVFDFAMNLNQRLQLHPRTVPEDFGEAGPAFYRGPDGKRVSDIEARAAEIEYRGKPATAALLLLLGELRDAKRLGDTNTVEGVLDELRGALSVARTEQAKRGLGHA